MTNSLNRWIATALLALLAAVAFVYLPNSSTTPAPATMAVTYPKKQRPTVKSVDSSAPAPEMISAKQPRKLIEPEITEVPKEAKHLTLPAETMVESAKKRALLQVDREIQSLKRVIPTLRPDQEQRVRKALELSLPKIKEKNGTLITTIRSPKPSLENPGMKEVYKTLDTDQQEAVNGLLERRQRTHDEAKATRSYTRAIESLPDLNEDQKDALHNYYLGLAGQNPPTREEQHKALAAFLSPDEIEILGDTHAIGGILDNYDSGSIGALRSSLLFDTQKDILKLK